MYYNFGTKNNAFLTFSFCRLHSSQVQGPGGANGSSSQAQQATRLNTTADTTVSMQEDSDELQEVIEVQILPQVGWKKNPLNHITFGWFQQ